MRGTTDVLRERSERGVARDPVEVLAAVHEQIATSPRAATSPNTASLHEDDLGHGRPANSDLPSYSGTERGHRPPRVRLAGIAACLGLVALVGVLVVHSQLQNDETAVGTGPEDEGVPTAAPSAPPEALPPLNRFLPPDPVAEVEVLRLEDGYSLHAAFDSQLCLTLRHGDQGGSACAEPRYLTDDTLLGVSSHIGDRRGYFISGVVGPDVSEVRATIAGESDRSVPVVDEPAFDDLGFFLLYIAPSERLHDLRAITHDGAEHAVMDDRRLASLTESIERFDDAAVDPTLGTGTAVMDAMARDVCPAAAAGMRLTGGRLTAGFDTTVADLAGMAGERDEPGDTPAVVCWYEGATFTAASDAPPATTDAFTVYIDGNIIHSRTTEGPIERP